MNDKQTYTGHRLLGELFVACLFATGLAVVGDWGYTAGQRSEREKMRLTNNTEIVSIIPKNLNTDNIEDLVLLYQNGEEHNFIFNGEKYVAEQQYLDSVNLLFNDMIISGADTTLFYNGSKTLFEYEKIK